MRVNHYGSVMSRTVFLPTSTINFSACLDVGTIRGWEQNEGGVNITRQHIEYNCSTKPCEYWIGWHNHFLSLAFCLLLSCYPLWHSQSSQPLSLAGSTYNSLLHRSRTQEQMQTNKPHPWLHLLKTKRPTSHVKQRMSNVWHQTDITRCTSRLLLQGYIGSQNM